MQLFDVEADPLCVMVVCRASRFSGVLLWGNRGLELECGDTWAC